MLGNMTASAGSTVVNGFSTLTQDARDTLNLLQTALSHTMEAFPIIIVTSRLIPLLVMLLFFWLIRLITGINLQLATISKPSATGHTLCSAIKEYASTGPKSATRSPGVLCHTGFRARHFFPRNSPGEWNAFSGGVFVSLTPSRPR